MLRVALTGGIGTGKSAVLARWRELGVSVIEADAIAHDVIRAGTPAALAIAARFGAEVMTPAGEVDRGRLAAVVFQDARARHDLETVVHPAVYAAIDAWLAECAGRGEPLAVAEIPLLYETGHAGDFDRVVVTACDADEQVRRIVARGGTEADAVRRLAAQWPLDRKVASADVVVRTDGTLDDTRERADAALEALRRSVRGRQTDL
jgi:dephospho-CoA kinase